MKTTSKMKTTSEMKMTSKMKRTSKMKMAQKNKDDLKNWPTPKKFFCPPFPSLRNLPEFFLMTSHLDSHTTTDVTPEMIPETGNGIPHDIYYTQHCP